MAKATQATATAVTENFSPLNHFAPARDFSDVLFGWQRLQWEALLSMQQTVAAAQQEWFDQWVSHWAGGVPIDA